MGRFCWSMMERKGKRTFLQKAEHPSPHKPKKGGHLLHRGGGEKSSISSIQKKKTNKKKGGHFPDVGNLLRKHQRLV